MQDNLINPQTVDNVIRTVFGSYEKFILSLIQRRKEIAKERELLEAKLAKLNKEDNLIKKVLTGYPSPKTDKPSLEDDLVQQTEDVKAQIKELDKEDKLMEEVLKDFHQMKVGEQYYDAESQSLSDSKPQHAREKTSEQESMKNIADLMLLKKDEYNQEAGKKVIDETTFISDALKEKSQISLHDSPIKAYENKIIEQIKTDYLPSSSSDQVREILRSHQFDSKIERAFKDNIESKFFVKAFAQEAKLDQIRLGRGVRV